MLSKEEILDYCRADSRVVVFSFGSARLRVPTANDRDRLDQLVEKSQGDWGGIRAWAAAQLLVDEEGARMFDSANQIANMPAAMAEEIWQEAAPLFGFDVDVGK